MPEDRGVSSGTTPMSTISRQSVISFKDRNRSRIIPGRASSRKDMAAPRKIPYKIHMDGVEVTPLPLMDIPSVAALAMTVAAGVVTDTAMQHMTEFVDFKQRSDIEKQPFHQPSTVGLQPMAAAANLPSMTDVTRLDDMYIMRSSTTIVSDESRAASAFRLSQDSVEYHEFRQDAPMTITLIETPFMTILDIASTTVVPDDPDYEFIKADRALYMAQRGVVKTRADAILQTVQIWQRARNTQESRKERANKQTMVTYWQLYDEKNKDHAESPNHRTILKQKRKQILRIAREGARPKQSLEALSSIDAFSTAEVSLDSPSVMEASGMWGMHGLSGSSMPNKLIGMINLENFRLAGLIIERLLQEKFDAPTQKEYCDLPPQDRFNPDIRYVYEFKTLWTFFTEHTTNRCVTSIAYSANPTIFAVGYGRYTFSTSVKPGHVCVWSIKNPIMPERNMKLNSPVQSCAFSKRHPNLLAVGLLSGSVVLMDISTPTGVTLHQSPETGEPIWSITWLQIESEGEDELLLAGTQDGWILRFRFSDTFKVIKMMRIARSFGAIRGIERTAAAMPVFHCLQYAAVTTLCECPFIPDGYLASTDDGYVHRCSAHYLTRHLSAVSSHLGPVYSCHVSPFIEQVYLTSGADWTIRIWAQGVNEPLLTLSSSMQPVEAAAWCTVDSALIASISGPVVSIWDLRRKTSDPAGTMTSPNNEPFSVLTWAPDGALVVGDRAGKVFVLKIEGAPLRPLLQAETLASCLRKALRATKPELFTALKRLGEPF